MATYTTPLLIISDHYDELVGEIDLYTEQLLEQYNDDDVLDDHWDISDHEEKPFKDISEWQDTIENWLDEYKKREFVENVPMRDPAMDLRSLKVKDYLQKTRTAMLEALYKARQENLDFYEENKEKFNVYGEKIDQPGTIEVLKRELFSNRFCFLLSTAQNANKKGRGFFGLSLVVTDFFLRKQDLDKLKAKDRYFNHFVEMEIKESIWPSLVSNYMSRLFWFSNDDLFLLNLSRQQILDETRKLHLRYQQDSTGDLSPLFQTNFTRLTHLKIESFGPDVKLHLLPASLEYLELQGIKFSRDAFPILPNLKYLKMHYCDFSGLCPDWPNSFPSLRVLCLNNPKGIFRLNTKYLENFTHFSCFFILYKTPTNILEDLGESLQVLEGFFSSQDLVRFRSPNLTALDVRQKHSAYFDCAHLSALPKLKRLHLGRSPKQNLNHPSLQALDFLSIELLGQDFPVLEPISNLKHLAISTSTVKVNDDYPSFFPFLVSLEISVHQISEFDPEFFARVPNLKRLELKNLGSQNKARLTHKLFSSNLAKLNELSIDINSNLGIFETGLFAGLNSLETLKLERIRDMSLPVGVFEGLEHLKFLYLEFSYYIKSFDLRIFLPLSNLQLLDLTVPSKFFLLRRDIVQFLAKQTQIKTLWYRQKNVDYFSSERFFDLDKIRSGK